MRKMIAWIIYIVDSIVPKNNTYFVFSSFPDITDNSYGVFRYIFNQKYAKQIIWLISDISKIDQYTEQLKVDMSLTEQDFRKILFIKKNSFNGFYKYLRSKYVFFTHGMYPTYSIPKNHILINLWHGMPLKLIGRLDDENKGIPESLYVIATSEFFQTFMSKAFDHTIENTLISGQPRYDLMFLENNALSRLGIDRSKYTKVFLWTPTYRQSIIGDIRTDGNVTNELPVINQDINELNDVLKKLNSYMIIKLHPMDILTRNKFEHYSNLAFLKNSDLEKKYCQLYSLLGEVDVLLTDFSSIYIDYLLLDRPIGFVMDDFDKYENSRGFVMEHPKNYMPGQFISQKEDLFYFLKQCTKDVDNYQLQRKRVNSLLNIQKENFSEYLWTMILERTK